MTYYKKSDYLETPEGQYSRYLWRKRRGQIHYFLNKEPQSKKSMSLDQKIKFQRDILNLMLRLKKRSYRSRIVVELFLNSTSKNPPHIHTAVKSLLDIFGRPLAQSGIKRKGLIYQDDRQIVILSVRYFFDRNKKGINARFVPLNYFLQDLKLAYNILNEDYADFYNCHEFQEEIEQIEYPHKVFSYGKTSDNLEDLLRNKDKYLQVISEKAFNEMIKMERMSIQESILNSFGLNIRNLYLIYCPLILFKNARRITSSRPIDPIQEIPTFLSKWVACSPIKIKLPNVPMREGETNHFKVKVRELMKKFLIDNKIYQQLYIPVNLEIIYKPPLTSNGFFKDLDNIMKLILPIFHDIFEPPPTRLSAVDLNDIKNLPLYNWLKKMIDNFPKSIKHTVLGFDIFEIPRDLKDISDGFITVGISGGPSMI